MTYNNGDYTDGGVRRTCLLDEGAVTVSNAYGIGGGTAATYAFAAEVKKGYVVTISTDTGNTWANTGGSLLVNLPANGTDLVFGIVIGGILLVCFSICAVFKSASFSLTSAL